MDVASRVDEIIRVGKLRLLGNFELEVSPTLCLRLTELVQGGYLDALEDLQARQTTLPRRQFRYYY